jgi:hypothetical protein
MEHIEETELDTVDHEPAKWLRYVDDSSVVWPHGPTRLQQLLYYLSSVRSTIKFKMEVDAYGTLLFLDVFAMKRGDKLATKVYRKPTHTGRYLYSNSNQPHDVNTEVVHGLISRAKLTCQNQKNLNKKIKNIRHHLMLKEYPQVSFLTYERE